MSSSYRIRVMSPKSTIGIDVQPVFVQQQPNRGQHEGVGRFRDPQPRLWPDLDPIP
jgi:hypothetical protein